MPKKIDPPALPSTLPPPSTLTDAATRYRRARAAVSTAKERVAASNDEHEKARLALVEAEEVLRRAEKSLLALAGD